MVIGGSTVLKIADDETATVDAVAVEEGVEIGL